MFVCFYLVVWPHSCNFFVVVFFAIADSVQPCVCVVSARHVVQDQKDIRRAMEFLHECDLLKIEDILPFFPDFVTIDHFKVTLQGTYSHLMTLVPCHQMGVSVPYHHITFVFGHQVVYS